MDPEEPAPAGSSPAHRLSIEVLADVVDAAIDGIALLDEGRRYLYVNAAGQRILGTESGVLIDRPAEPFTAGEACTDRPAFRTTLVRPDGQRRDLEYSSSTIGDETCIHFRDVTETRQQARWLGAIARAASSIALGGSFGGALNTIAEEVRTATGVPACSIVLIDETSLALSVAGASGYSEDYLERLEAARRLGAPLLTVEAFRTREPVIALDFRSTALADPRWAPMHDLLENSDWDALVVLPLLLSDRVLGALTAYYPLGAVPGKADVEFLSTMADQAALAAENTRLLTELRHAGAVEERGRIARDLHDSISQALFSMTLHTRAIQLALGDSGRALDPVRARDGVADLRTLIQTTLADMRTLIFELRPEVIDDYGLVGATERYTAEIAGRHNLEITLDADETAEELPASVATQAFLLLREALHNVVKHAHATTARVRVDRTSDTCCVLEVADDGIGFDAEGDFPGRLGLASMRERAERLGGQLEVKSTPGLGSTIRAMLPTSPQER